MRSATFLTLFGGRRSSGPSLPDMLYNDELTTARVAAAINGSALEPGPGNRVAVDTTSQSSISGGAYNLGAKGTYGDPGLWFPAVTRAVGQVIATRVTGGGYSWMFGIDSNQSGLPHETGLWFTSNGIQTYDNASGPIFGVWSPGDAIDISVVLRAKGAWTFIRQPLWGTDFELAFVHYGAGGNAGTVYPGFVGHQGAAVFEYLRVLADKWAPAPLISDGFGTAFGTTDGLGHPEGLTGGLGAGGSGIAWTTVEGTWGVSVATAVATALDGVSGAAIAVADAGEADTHILCTLTRSAGTVGLVFRYADANNYLRLDWDGTDWTLTKVVAGTPSTVGTITAANGLVRVMLRGDLLYISAGDTSLFAEVLTDAGLLTGTKTGLYTTDTGNTFDNYQVWSRIGSGL